MNIYADRNEVKIRVKYIDIPIRYIYIFTSYSSLLLYLYIWMDETYKYNLERMCCL